MRALPSPAVRAFAAFRRRDAVEERLGAGARDRAQRLDHLVARHADAVIFDRQQLFVGIDEKRDARLHVVAEQRRIGDGLVAQPLAGVRGVGDQLAQKHRLVGIDRVHHQVQKLGNVGLERPAFRLVLLGHRHDGSPAKIIGPEMERWRRGFKIAAAQAGPSRAQRPQRSRAAAHHFVLRCARETCALHRYPHRRP